MGLKKVKVIQNEKNEVREFSVLLALAALALLVAPSHPMVYGAGAALLAIPRPSTPPGLESANAPFGARGGSVVAPTKDARAKSLKLPLPAGGILRFSRKTPFAKACKPIPTPPLEEVREAGGVSRRKPRPL